MLQKKKKNVAPKLHEILSSAIKCISSIIKANAKAERVFRRFREATHAYHGQWLNWKFEPWGEILLEEGPPVGAYRGV